MSGLQHPPRFSFIIPANAQTERAVNPNPLAPIAAGERIEALDVLRGFALVGILLMNM